MLIARTLCITFWSSFRTGLTLVVARVAIALVVVFRAAISRRIIVATTVLATARLAATIFLILALLAAALFWLLFRFGISCAK